jgi:hypothetical protein
MLAQEEYAKAFLLCLVKAEALPWSGDVKRALHDHICKQLTALILDYLAPDVDEFLKRHNLSRLEESRPILPANVLDAIHIICHERIPRERDRWWLDESRSEPDAWVKRIADGRLYGQKQDAFYVRIGADGGVVSTPDHISRERAVTEFERARRIGGELRFREKGSLEAGGLDSEKVIAIFRLLTGAISPEDFDRNWWAR